MEDCIVPALFKENLGAGPSMSSSTPGAASGAGITIPRASGKYSMTLASFHYNWGTLPPKRAVKSKELYQGAEEPHGGQRLQSLKRFTFAQFVSSSLHSEKINTQHITLINVMKMYYTYAEGPLRSVIVPDVNPLESGE